MGVSSFYRHHLYFFSASSFIAQLNLGNTSFLLHLQLYVPTAKTGRMNGRSATPRISHRVNMGKSAIVDFLENGRSAFN